MAPLINLLLLIAYLATIGPVPESLDEQATDASTGWASLKNAAAVAGLASGRSAASSTVGASRSPW